MMNDFALRLTEIRKHAKMTQAEVAERLNVSFQAVSLWERGETTPELGKIVEIASLFHVTTDWLLMGRTRNPVVMDLQVSLSDRLFNEERMYTYVKTYATIKHMNQTIQVLPYARELHKGQYRKGKDHVPYIYHPLLIACHALALGLDEDNLVSAALLHDVCEDCGVAVEDLPVNNETKTAVELLTKKKTMRNHEEERMAQYYEDIMDNRIAAMVKLLDRCNNVSGMASGFSQERMAEYIQETEKWFLPMMHEAKKRYPMYSNQVFLIKYHMTSVLAAIKHQMQEN